MKSQPSNQPLTTSPLLNPAALPASLDRQPLVVSPHTGLHEVLACMSEGSKSDPGNGPKTQSTLPSYALVRSQNRLVGIVTERDLVKQSATGVSFSQVTVAEVMSRKLVTLTASEFTDSRRPWAVFQTKNIRHLPITTEAGDLVGVVTTESIRKVLEPPMLLKLHPVSEVMTSAVVTAAPQATVRQLAQRMTIHQVSCVVLVEPHPQSGVIQPLGLVTERDIVQAQALDLDFRTTLAESIMSTPLVSLTPDDTLWDAYQMMQRQHVQRLVVIGQQGDLAGILSQISILAALKAPDADSTPEVRQHPVQPLKDQQSPAPVKADATALEANPEALRAMFEQAVVGIAHLNLQGQFLWVNPCCCTLLGRSPTQLRQCSLDEVVQMGDLGSHWRQTLLQKQQASLQLEQRYHHGQGQLVWADMTISLVTPGEGAPDYFMVIWQDICDRKQAELEVQYLNRELEARVALGTSAFRASEQRFRTLFNAVPDALFVLDLQGMARKVNQGALEQSGFTASDFLGHPIKDFLSAASQSEFDSYLAQLLDQGHHRQKMEFVRQDGTRMVVDCAGDVITDPARHEPYILMTQRHISEPACPDNEHQFRLMADHAPVLLRLLDLDQHCSFLNQGWLQFTGQPLEQERGEGWTQRVHPEDLPILLRKYRTAFDAREAVCLEYRLQRHDGVYRWLLEMGVPRYSPQGELSGYISSGVDITDRKTLEDQVRSSEAQIRAVFDGMKDIVFVFDVQSQQINAIPPSLVSSEMVDLIHQTADILFLENEQAQGFHGHIRQALMAHETVTFEYRLPAADSWNWFVASITPLSDTSVIWVAQNITERKSIEQELFHEKELAQVTLQSIGDAVITTDVQGHIRHLNGVAEQLTGWLASQAQGRPIHEVFRVVTEGPHPTDINLIATVLATGQMATAEQPALLMARNGHECTIEHSAVPLRDRTDQILGIVMVFRDVSQSRQLTQQMSWQANHDPLTGLVNRHQFEQLLQQALQSAHQDQQHHVLCHLNLDQFKIVNDTCGHAAGDQLLQQAAQLLQQTIRNTDIVARLGGDEFSLLLRQCSLEQAQVIVEQLRQRLQAFRFNWHQQTFSIGVSMGLVSIDYDSQNLTSLLSAADAACYAAKARGPNRTHIYQLDDLELVQQRGTQRWSRRIKQALEDNRFRLYGQAIVPAAQDHGGLRQCCEVLLRMVDEQNQVVSAGTFLPAAERYNLMPEIDRWVIRQFLADHFNPPQISQQGADQPSPYMINLSGASIGDEQFLQFLQEQFQHYPHAARQICFEITETAAISNLNQAITFIQDLKQLGCRFALDDFGSGLSSFAYLKTLPVDYLKIDGHFIEDMADDPATHAIVESIIHIGHVMGLQTIAESVGDLATRRKLQAMGIDYVQGFGIALPCSLTYE